MHRQLAPWPPGDSGGCHGLLAPRRFREVEVAVPTIRGRVVFQLGHL